MISRTLQNSLPWLESITLMDLPPKDPMLIPQRLNRRRAILQESSPGKQALQTSGLTVYIAHAVAMPTSHKRRTAITTASHATEIAIDIRVGDLVEIGIAFQ